MAENSKIEWCDHTFNPWMGCTKVSPGCKHCYAETLIDHRYGKVTWGPQGKRIRTTDAYWRKPLRWNNTTWLICDDCGWRGSEKEQGRFEGRAVCPSCESVHLMESRQRVFCASLADIFEDREEVAAWRIDLFRLIKDTPNLDWLILTKRPENVIQFMDDACSPETGCPVFGVDEALPDNVWIGTSVEDQKHAETRIPQLIRIPAKVRFLSVEPMLGPVRISEWKDVHWVIAGGESGPEARLIDPRWVRSLRDQCQDAGVPFFFKQWGEWAPREVLQISDSSRFKHKPVAMDGTMMFRVGKGMAGRVLDGREWMEWPQ